MELYTEIHGSTANSCPIELVKKDKTMLEDYILINYSRSSASNTFHLNDYIPLTLQADTDSIDDFKTKFKAATLRQKQNWKVLKIKDLNLSYKKTINSLPTISFSLRLVYLTTIFKNQQRTVTFFFLAQTKHSLIHHLFQNHYHYTVNKSTESR